jgi:hypothetical protein
MYKRNYSELCNEEAYIIRVCTSFVGIIPVSTSVDNIDSQLPTDHDDRMSSRGWLVHGIKHNS